MAKLSAGLLLYRGAGGQKGFGRLEVFLVHPGGPLWVKKDLGAWSIPKGEVPPGTDLLTHARDEFREETGHDIDGEFRPLVPVKQAGGKTVHAWAVAGDCDAGRITSNTFSLEWPPRSGRIREFPEVDRAEWFDLPTARQKINPAQAGLLAQLESLLTVPPGPRGGPVR